MSAIDHHRIRATEPRDIPDLYRVRSSTRQNAISKRQLIEWGITPRSITDGFESGRFVGFVCEHGEQVVGFCTGDTETGEVTVLAVLPEHEGMGVGLSLLTGVVQALTRRGHARIWLACSSDPNSRSHGFYRGNGWIASGEKLENGDDILVVPGQPRMVARSLIHRLERCRRESRGNQYGPDGAQKRLTIASTRPFQRFATLMEHDCDNLLRNIGKLHTTEMGIERIARNLGLNDLDVVEWCKARSADKNCQIVRRGKNWYASCGDCTMTINAHSYTIITAHRTKVRTASLPRADERIA